MSGIKLFTEYGNNMIRKFLMLFPRYRMKQLKKIINSEEFQKSPPGASQSRVEICEYLLRNKMIRTPEEYIYVLNKGL